jgi:hypothetical protein
MSYDLAVWEGDPPATHAEALATFDRLYDQLMESGQLIPPTPRIQHYVDQLLSPNRDPISRLGLARPHRRGIADHALRLQFVDVLVGQPQCGQHLVVVLPE